MDTIPDTAVTALQQMHPDPFVQTAVWRLFREAPGLLDMAAVIILTDATKEV